MTANIDNHLRGIYQVLRSRINLINKSIGHSSTQGSANEEEIRQLLIEMLPHDYGVGSGIIIGTDGKSSKQIDIIIYDKNKPNYSLATNSKIYLADHVIAVIEIKTTYTSGEEGSLHEALENIKSVKNLKTSKNIWSDWIHNPDNGNMELTGNLKSSSPLGIIFFFSRQPHKQSLNLDAFIAGLKKEINGYDLNDRPDLLFSLDHATFFKFTDLNREKDTSVYSVCMVPNHDDQTQTIDLADFKKENKYVVDFRQDSKFGVGEVGMSRVGKNFAIEGCADEPWMYNVAKYNDRFYLLDKFRAFLNFFWAIEKLVDIKHMNPFWDIKDYFGKDIVINSNYDTDFK